MTKFTAYFSGCDPPGKAHFLRCTQFYCCTESILVLANTTWNLAPLAPLKAELWVHEYQKMKITLKKIGHFRDPPRKEGVKENLFMSRQKLCIWCCLQWMLLKKFSCRELCLFKILMFLWAYLLMLGPWFLSRSLFLCFCSNGGIEVLQPQRQYLPM